MRETRGWTAKSERIRKKHEKYLSDEKQGIIIMYHCVSAYILLALFYSCVSVDPLFCNFHEPLSTETSTRSTTLSPLNAQPLNVARLTDAGMVVSGVGYVKTEDSFAR